MGILGEYEFKRALEKEQKPRNFWGIKVEKCGDCPRLWHNYKGNSYGLCQNMGYQITKPEEMCRMCVVPLWTKENEEGAKDALKVLKEYKTWK